MAEFSPEELARCIEILEQLVEDRTRLVKLSQADRIALLVAAGRLSRPTRHEGQRENKAFRRYSKQTARESDRAARAETAIRVARQAAVYAPPPELPGTSSATRPRELKNPRACYVCKTEYRKLHFFYDSMCEECAEFNYRKRFQSASLVGKVALITGARVKIGFRAALMMLRAGARVIVSTRFPRDAAERFARETDYDSFAERLEVHGLDLRHCASVELFARSLEQRLDRLDILINNAAQTVRRPPGFYRHLLELELGPLSLVSARAARLLAEHEACKAKFSGHFAHVRALGFGEQTGIVAERADAEQGLAPGIARSAALSQVPLSYDEASGAAELFPSGRMDADLQQIDLREMNSWRLALADVPAPEMLEVQLVNAVAPFILCSKLKSLMMRVPSRDKHIVNVSAIEGQFARYTKTDKHPHTNMAKAALNMMTFTSAPDYAEHGIFMNAVDTGWVTDEDPLVHAERKQREADFQPPLDIVDGAARICDPFFSGLLTGEHVFGKFLKDYKPAPW
ncbi:MAG TPA: SDR family NAD(P)-dependent oxidoreductase [Polyangiaceae bacterium]|jgi:NAD(P)-dependent dehydrogenase (short-subunit alcohol dehydrogenase family)|nr:SDR family NAD(P)-dependent oxidoreductase [Polyangiaceae bacterium]